MHNTSIHLAQNRSEDSSKWLPNIFGLSGTKEVRGCNCLGRGSPHPPADVADRGFTEGEIFPAAGRFWPTATHPCLLEARFLLGRIIHPEF
jgi:hypothetical protein